jgi:glycosyltransferase involved in cell wall biosynthesis
LRDDGHFVGFAPNVAYGPGHMEISGMPVHAQGTGFSEQPTIMHYLNHKYDCLLAQYDMWALHTLFNLVRENRVILVPYVPLDHAQIHPGLVEKLQLSTYNIAMCKYGLNQLNLAGFKNNSTFIYHGVDCGTFKPIHSEIPKTRLKQEIGFEQDAFVIGLVKMNKGTRSAFPRQLEIIKSFIDQNPDIKTRVYLHTELNSPSGYHLETVLKMLGIGNITRVANEYLLLTAAYSDIAMTKMYNACDVTMACTLSEGFGMPIIESMACGTPVVAGNYTSMTELLQPVTPELLVDPLTTIWEQVPAKYYLVDIDKGAEALEKVANTDPTKYTKKLSDYALKTFDWRTAIGPQWKQFFKKTLPDYIEENCLKIPEASEFLKNNAKPVEART